MAKKVYLKGEEFVFSRVKGNKESTYRDGDINLTPANIGASAEGHTHDDRYYTESEINTKLNDKANSSHTHGNSDITGIDGSKITSGTIDLARLPQGALERLTVVADDTARFKLTSSNVQKGDTVKVTSTGKMYYVVDETKLSSEAGYEVYAAGTAASVPWSGVTGKPSTYTPSSHTHTKSQISDFPTSMPASDVPAWAKASSKPTYTKAEVGLGNVDNTADASKNVKSTKKIQTYKQGSTTETYGDEYPIYAQWRDSSHVRMKCDNYTVETDYATSAGSAKSADSATSVPWSGVTGKPSTYTPSSHTHTKSQISDFPTSMPASDVPAWAKASSKPTYTKAEVGLGNVDNTADANKRVAHANTASQLGNQLTLCICDGDGNIVRTDVFNGNKSKKIVLAHGGHTHSQYLTSDYDTKNCTTTFESGDSSTGDSTAPAVITSGETHKSLFNKISTAVKNVRWLLSKMGTTDISAIGNGTVTGALSTLNSNRKWTMITSSTAVQITAEMVAKYEEFKFILIYNNQVLAEATYPSVTVIISASEDRIIRLGGYYQSPSNCAMFGIRKTSDRYFRTDVGWYLNCINNDWIEPTIVLLAR